MASYSYDPNRPFMNGDDFKSFLIGLGIGIVLLIVFVLSVRIF